jgi:microtubule-associated protein-like 6
LPDANIKIKYVHGYRSEDVRNNVKWAKNGSVLYHTAALGILLDYDKNIQTFFNQHTHDIISLAIHPNV